MKIRKKLASILVTAILLSLSPVFAEVSSHFKNHQKRTPEYYNYPSPQAYYNGYDYGYDYDRYRRDEFLRKVFIISKMAERNPGVQYKYTSTSAVYL